MTASIDSAIVDQILKQSKDAQFRGIAEKVIEGKRLDHAEGLYLLEEAEAGSLKRLADFNRRTRVGDTVTFASTLYIHPTNLCELSCPMC
ncbi:MAG: hypothetical protein KDK78_12545, partial [Chlamydiia bacterium]|nr:hypothetical protein [Chlamydiia bacterium]